MKAAVQYIQNLKDNKMEAHNVKGVPSKEREKSAGQAAFFNY